MTTRHIFATVMVMIGGILFLNTCQVDAQTTIPILFTRSIDASKARPGDAVLAKTIQIVLLPGGSEIPKDSMVLGHVTIARFFSFDPTPYAVQQASVLAIHFDKLVTKSASTDVSLSVRALADRLSSEDASTPHYLDETDAVGTKVQVGGDTFSPLGKDVVSLQGDIVGYNRQKGVFARLLPSEYTSRYSNFQCTGTDSEQSVAIFSATACGLYGFADVYIADNGQDENRGTFRLESRRHAVKLYGQSTALLQIIATR